MIDDYRKTIEGVPPVLTAENAELVAKTAALPDTIRGYGYVKDENLRKYEQELARNCSRRSTASSRPRSRSRPAERSDRPRMQRKRS